MLSWLKRLFRRETLTLREGSPATHVFMAEHELRPGGKLKHGLAHVAELLALDPVRPEWLALLDAYLARGDLERHLTRDGYYANVALWAWELNRRGQVVAAAETLLQVMLAKQDARYLHDWLVDWLEPPGALESLAPDVQWMVLGLGLNILPKADPLPRHERLARRLAAMAERAQVTEPAHDTFRLGLFRKAGRLEEGLRLAREAVDQRPSWHSWTALAMILQSAGEPEEADAAYLRAAQLDPTDRAALSHRAEMFLALERWAEAREAYARLLAVEPGEPAAAAAEAWCRWKESAQPEPSPEFLELAQQGNARALDLLKGAFAPYMSSLPERGEAGADILRQLDPPIQQAELRVSDVEAPSLMLAFGLAGVSLKVTYEKIATPDPRIRLAPVAHELWRRDGEVLRPGLPEPSPEVCVAIGGLAGTPYRLWPWWAEAARLGQRLQATAAPDLLAALVHPPQPPEGQDVLSWVALWQFATTMILAHVDAGWERSVRQQALYSLLWGPRDWTTEWAIVVLSLLAQEEPALACDIHEAFTRLDQAEPNSGFWSYRDTLLRHWPGLPCLFDRERSALEARWKKWVSDS